MAEQRHPLVELTEEVANELKIDDLEKKVDLYAEREKKDGDIDVDALNTVLKDNLLTAADKERVVKIVNLMADASKLTGQDMFFEVMSIYITLKSKHETEEQPPAA